MHELDFSDGNLSAAGGFWFRQVLRQVSRRGGPCDLTASENPPRRVAQARGEHERCQVTSASGGQDLTE